MKSDENHSKSCIFAFVNRLTTLLFIFSLLLSFSVSAQKITFSDWKKIVPSDALPKNVKTRHSNNNVDLTKYHGKYYMVFRTAPTHFASVKTKMYVLSSYDLKKWDYETQFHLGTDMREPRFLIYKDQLFLYFFQGGKNPFGFHPQHIFMSRFQTAGNWTPNESIGLDGYVDWRFRTRNDTAYLSAYYGVDLYKASHHGDLRLFYSTDGKSWKPISEEAQVTRPGAEEGEFIFDKKGNLWATIRLESEGALICYADRDSIYKWHTVHSDYKFDSALMFERDDDIYVVSRRNLDGTLNKAPEWLPYWIRQKYNLLRYSFTQKCTALFKFNKKLMRLDHIMDFPSTGDNAFPAIAQADDNSYILMNYSSDFTKRSKNWIRGQLGKTFIYMAKLNFSLDGIDASFLH